MIRCETCGEETATGVCLVCHRIARPGWCETCGAPLDIDGGCPVCEMGDAA